MSYYLSTVAVYLGVDLMAAWALNMQFGWAGVPNFAFIIFQAAGAYAAGVVTLGPDTGANSFQHYILGAQLPFPVPLLVAAAAGGLVSLFVGLLTLRRLRRDYQAAVFLLVAVIASDVAAADVHLFNGSNGIAGVPQPLAGALSSLGPSAYQWLYAAFVAVICVAGAAAGPQARALGLAAGAARGPRRRAGSQSARPQCGAAAHAGVRHRRGARGPQRWAARRVHRGVVARRLAVRGDVRDPDRNHPRRCREQLGSAARHLPGADPVRRGPVLPPADRLSGPDRRARLGGDRLRSGSWSCSCGRAASGPNGATERSPPRRRPANPGKP